MWLNTIYLMSSPPLDQVKGTVFNLVADHLSHGRVAQARCIVEREFGVPLRMC